MATTTIYLIARTDGNSSFSIQPNTFNGPGGSQQSSDLTLYGNGAPNWGQEFNENFYRLLENWAVPSRVGDGGNPDEPQTASDIGGSDVGINVPVIGQTWYNKTSGHLFVYSGPSNGWQLSNVVTKAPPAPTSPVDGSLWFDTGTTRLKVWDGTSWISHVLLDGDTMTGILTLSGDPTNPLEAATKQYVDNTAVSVSGDTMTGLLTLSGDPTSNLHAATKQYVDNSTDELNDINNVNTSPSDGDVLAFNNSSSDWEESPAADHTIPAGVVWPFAGPDTAAPTGWLLCSGQAVSRTTFSRLFNTIGITYGSGDGSTTFNLPDMRDRFPLGERSQGSTDASRVDNFGTQLGDTGGKDDHQLTEAEMPSHNHALRDGSGGNNTNSITLDGGNLSGQDNATVFRTGSVQDQIMQKAGTDQPHNNMPPFVTFTYIIKT